MGLFDSLTSLTGNLVKIAVTPVEIVADLADAAVKPIAETAEEIKNAVKDLTK